MMKQIIYLGRSGQQNFLCKKINDLIIILDVFIPQASQYFLAPSQNNNRGALSTKIRPTDTSTGH